MTRSQIATANFFDGFIANKKVLRPKRLVIWATEIEEYVRFKRIKTENGFLYFWVGIGLRKYTDGKVMLFTSTTKNIIHNKKPEPEEVCYYWFQCRPIGAIYEDQSRLKIMPATHDNNKDGKLNYLINFEDPNWIVKSEFEKLLVQWYEVYSKTQNNI